MSVQDRAAAAAIAQIVLTADGALFGLGMAYVAYRIIRKLVGTSSALRKIRDAPFVSPSDLRALLSSEEKGGGDGDRGEGKLFLVRGSVESKSSVDFGVNWKGFRGIHGNGNVIVSQESGDRGVIWQRTETCIFNEWRGVFGLTADFCSIISRSIKEKMSSTTRTVPFVLVQTGKWPPNDYIVVNMEGSKHKLPLDTVYHHFQPISATPYTLFQALLGLQHPVAVLYEEKMLPLGKYITAVGTCRMKNGIPEIRSQEDLPYFLSHLTKDQIVDELSFTTGLLKWSGFVFGSFAVGILGYAIVRNCMRWQRWRNNRRRASEENAAPQQEDEEAGEVPDGELCAVCLVRRRRSAFVPCGHLVCCQRCALSVERDASPKCPVCRQTITTSVRIFDS